MGNKETISPVESKVNIYIGIFCLVLVAISIWSYFTHPPEPSRPVYFLLITLVFDIFLLISGLYLIFNPKETMKWETHVKVIKGSTYGFIIGLAVIWTVFLIVAVYLSLKHGTLTNEIILTLIFATLLIALVGLLEFFYMKGLLEGKKWIRIIFATVSIIYLIKYISSLVLMIKYREYTLQFVIVLITIIIVGLLLFFVLRNKKIREFYSK